MELIKQIEEKYQLALKDEFIDPEKSYSLAGQGYEMAKAAGLKKEEADGLYRMSCACRVTSDYSNGLAHALEALDIYAELKNDIGIVDAMMMIGIIYFYFGDYGNALEYFVGAEAAITDDLPKRRKVVAANNIGEVYREAGDYESALVNYQKGLDLAADCGMEGKTPYLYINISDVYLKQSKLDVAFEACQKAYETMAEEDDVISTAEVDYKLGKLHMLKGDYERAEKLYYKALTNLNRMNNKFYLIELLINMSELAELRDQSPLSFLEEALETAQAIHSDLKISRIYKLLSNYYETKGNYKSALTYYKHYHMKEKEIEADNLSHRLALMLVEIDHSKEKHESERLKALSDKLKRDISKSNEELDKIRQENEMLLKENSIDELTRTYNRRGIYQKFKEVLANEGGRQSAVFLIDIDHFKDYNDTWGHIQGDICLKMVAQAMQHVAAKSYFVGRYGGEEFICYAQVKEAEEVEAIGERIRQAVADLKMPVSKEDTDGYLTVSVGAAIGKMDNDTIQKWIDLADRQLYVAKRKGRNQVRVQVSL